MKNNEFPSGWDIELIKRVIDNYQYFPKNPEYIQDREKDYSIKNNSLEIPTELVPVIHKLISKYKAA